jgi:hypothetical protein
MSGPVNPTVVVHSAPTTFTDGTAIPADAIVKYQYGFGQASGNYTVTLDDVDLTTDANGKQFCQIPQLPAFGQWFAAGRAVTKDGGTGKWSNEAAFTTEAKEPSPITDFSVGP